MRAEIPRHTVSVAAVVLNADGRVLGIRRADNGHWEPPGGLLELGKGIHEGLAREVIEETGLVIELVALTGVYRTWPAGSSRWCSAASCLTGGCNAPSRRGTRGG